MLTFFYSIIYTYNIVNCQKIYNLFAQALETRFSSLFHSECKLIWYSTTMYVYCVYPAISKRSKTTAKIVWNKRRSKCFKRRHLWRRCLYCYHFFLLLNRNRGTWSYILVSDRPYITKIYPVNAIWLLK